MPTEDLVSAIFSKLKITKVICVDDAYSNTIEPADIVGQVAALYPDLDECKDWFGPGPDLVSLEELEFIEERVEQFVRTSLVTEHDRRSFYIRLQRLVSKRLVAVGAVGEAREPFQADGNDHVELVRDLRSASRLHDLMGLVRGVTFLEVSPERWRADPEGILGNLDDNNRCLLLADYDLKDGTGVDLLARIPNLNAAPFVIGALFSHTFKPETERTRAVELAEESGLPVGSLFLLSKSRIHSDRFLKLAEGLKDVALNVAAQKLLDIFQAVRVAAEERAHKRLSAWSSYALHSVVVQSSEDEGIWHIYTLRRLLDTVRNMELRVLSETPDQRREFEERVTLIKQLQAIGEELTVTVRSDDVWAIKQEELFEDGEILNTLYTPLRLGDIFALRSGTDERLFILLAQPCDLMLRGSRPSVVYIAPITKEGASKNQLDGGTAALFKDFARQGQYLVDFKEALQVPTLILDLAVFRQDGLCSFDLTGAAPTDMITPWLDRYNQVGTHLTGLQANLVAIDGSTMDAASKEALRIALLEPYRVGTSIPTFIGNTFSTDLSRVRHYKEPWVSHMLKRFSDFLGRPAFEHNIPIPQGEAAAGRQ